MVSRSEPVPRSITVASMRSQLGLAVLLFAVGADICWAGPRQRGAFVGGALFGVGLTALALSAVFAWAAWMTWRHLNEPPAYWQELQDRNRPRVIRSLFAFAGCAATAAGVGYGLDTARIAGAFAAVSLAALSIAVLTVTGGIRPIRYE